MRIIKLYRAHAYFIRIVLSLFVLLGASLVVNGQQENQPILLTPFNEQVISSEAELRSTIFSWTGAQSDFGYQLAIYPVYPCQDPLTAFRVNHPMYVQFAGDEFFFLTENMNFNDGTYVWSVTTESNENHHWSPPSIFILETGNGSGIFIETGNPCDTPAGCSQITFEPEKEIPLDFMASKPKGDQFIYPRALPIILDGKDYDKVTFRCKGCSADDGTEVQYVEDRVSNYKWELIGKGSLGDAFKRKKTDSIQAEIDKLNAKIEQLISKIKTKQHRLDSEIDSLIDGHTDRIGELEKEVSGLDSLQQVLDKTSDSLKNKLSEVNTELAQKRITLKNKRDSIATLEGRIDTLNGLLSGKFSNAETQLLQEVELLNNQYEAINTEIEAANIDLKTQLNDQELIINRLESLVRTKSGQYEQLRAQIETVTQEITSINNQLYSNSYLFNYYQARNSWRSIMFAFNQTYSIKNYTTKVQEVDNAAQKVALSSANKSAEYGVFANLMDDLLKEARTSFQKSSNKSGDGLTIVEQSSNLLKLRLDSVAIFGVSLDNNLVQRLSTEKNKLTTFEGQSASVESDLEDAVKRFQKAQLDVDKTIQNFENKLEKLEEKKKAKLDELTNVQGQLRALTSKREATTAQNKGAYVEEIESKELTKLGIQLSLSSVFEDIIEKQRDSLIITREIKFVNADKRDIIQQKQQIKAEIENLKNENSRLESEKSALRSEIKNLNKELEKLQKKKEDLLGNLEEATKAMKSATGSIVYYIPPTLDELLKGSGRETEFKKLVNKVEVQKDSLSIAMKEKENLQLLYAQMAVDVAKDLLKLKEIEESLEKIKTDQAKASKSVQDQSFEAGKRIRSSREEEAKKREELEANKKESKEAIEDLAETKKDLEKRLKQQRELVEKNDSLLSDIKDEIKQREKLLFDEQQNERQRKNNIADNTQKLREKKQEETRLIREIGQKRNALTLASAQDDIAAIASNQKALNQLDKDLLKIKEDIRFYVTELGVMAGKLKDLREKQEKIRNEIKTRKERIQTIQLNHHPNVDQLRKMINELDEKSAVLHELKKDDLRLQAIDADTAVETADVDSLMKKDEKLQKAKKELDELNAKQKKLETEKQRAEKNIETVIEDKKTKKASVESSLKKAEENLKKARKELKDFIDGEFERASFDTKIKIIGDDDVVDQWRSDDDAKTKVITLSYKNRVPFINDNMSVVKPDNEESSSGCYPIIKTDVGEAPDVTSIIPGNEPRTLALLYENGKLLYDKWPVIPDTIKDILAKDVVITVAGLKDDVDELSYQCISSGETEDEKYIRLGEDVPSSSSSESSSRPTTGTDSNTGETNTGSTQERGSGTETSSETNGTNDGGEETEDIEEEEDFCVSLAGLTDPIIDLGLFTFSAKNIAGPNTKKNIGVFLWEPRDVAKDLPEEKQDIEVKYLASDIYKDEEVGLLKKELVKAGIMVETTDTIRGVPGGKSAISTRIIRGNHRGLIGEEIRLTATSLYGNATSFGFDENGTTTKSVSTSNGGYLKDVYFYYGKKYDAFTINVEWLRGGNVVESATIYAETPLLHHFRLLAYQINESSLNKALKMVDGESAATAGALSSIDTKDQSNYLFYGTQNYDKSFASLIELSFKAQGKVKIEPESSETSIFGLAWTVLKEAPKDAQFDVKSKTPETYKEISKEHEVSGKVDTDKVKSFKIGSPINPFIITLQKEISPGQTIQGKANIDIQGLSTDLEVLNVLKDIELMVEDVKVEKRGEELIATAGKVTYTSTEGKKFTALSSFDFTLKTFGVTAGSGGILIGTVKHEKLKEAVNFEAEIDPSGNFLGKLSNLPEIEVKEFVLEKGASVVLDMHSDRSKDVIPYKGSFYGIVIQQATLRLPKSFNKKGVEEATTIAVEDFYISKEGFGGTIESKGQLLSAGFSGYECRINNIKVVFDRSELKEGSFGGNLILPSPMEGEVGIGITAATNKFAGELSTDKPIQLPQFKTTFILRKAALSYDFEKELGTLEIGALINSEKFGDVSIDGFVLKSNGEVKADSIKVEKDIEIGAGFKMNLRKIGFAFKDRTSYSINFDGKVDLKGILAIDAKAKVKPGPSLTFDELKVDFDKGPMKFAGSFTYQESVFQGDFDVNLKKCNKGLSGFVIVGSQKISNTSSFTYWYGEISSSVAIPIAQTGFSFLEFGGGVGYNYIPPLGSAQGSPLKDDGFSLKALVGIGNVPTGELIAGRMEMSYIAGRISLFGKAWALTKEESMYGEGRINVVLNDNPKVDGYIAALLGLPDAKGSVFIARGKMNISYPPNQGRYVWTEQVNASLLKTLNAKASLVISENDVHMTGTLTYDLEKTVSIGSVASLSANFDLDAGLDLRYVYKTSTGTVRPALAGVWDVNAKAFSKTYDILSGAVTIKDAELKITPSQISITGFASATYSLPLYSGSKEIRIDYTSAL